MEEWPPVWSVAANILNKQSQAADMGWSSCLGVSEMLTTPDPRNWPRYKTDALAFGLDWSFHDRDKWRALVNVVMKFWVL